MSKTEQQKLHSISEQFYKKTSLRILLSAEIEFYIRTRDDKDVVFFCQKYLYEKLIGLGFNISPIITETGTRQFEFNFLEPCIPTILANNLFNIRTEISEFIHSHGFESYFEAKPFDNEPGSGMHIHISLHDKNGLNLFSKNHDSSNNESLYMQYALGGLLEALPESMKFFAPHTDSYKRFTDKQNTATTVSWGGNNRTVALRIPSDTNTNRHIEHRIPGIDANPYTVISVIILAIMHGLENKLIPLFPKVYGNANDLQYLQTPYQLKKLPTSYDDAYSIKNTILETFCI